MALTEEQYRALAREADGLRSAQPVAAETPRSKLVPMLLIAAGAAGLVYLFSPVGDGPRRRLTDPVREAFSPSQIDIQFPPVPPVRTSDRIRVEPQPPPPTVPPVPPPIEPPAPPAPVVVQTSPVATPIDDEAARRAAEEAERRRWERLRSPMMVFDDASGGGNAARDPERVALANEETDANRRFLDRASNAGVETSVAGQIRRIDALVAQGTMIRGVLETAINSDLPGIVRAQTLEDVWSFDGRRVLIPKGSRLIGEYRSGITRGQTRVFIVWTRMLRADGASVQLGSIGTDALGRSGMPGEVDNKYLERFGSAILLSVVGGATQFIAGLGQNTNDAVSSTLQIVDPATGDHQRAARHIISPAYRQCPPDRGCPDRADPDPAGAGSAEGFDQYPADDPCRPGRENHCLRAPRSRLLGFLSRSGPRSPA
jgi:type IV secretion system protein VirB10